jgi:hypothetical protein
MNFSSNIDNAKRSLAKVIDHRIERLTTLLDLNETQPNVQNRIEISIKSNNEASDDNSCSSTIKAKSIYQCQIINAKIKEIQS